MQRHFGVSRSGIRTTLRSSFALVDQAVVSVGNFLSILLLARSLPPVEFGTFILIYGACQIANGLHSNLVVSPLVVFSSPVTIDRARVYSTASLYLTGAFSVVCAAIVLAAAGSLHFVLGGCLALASVVAWQIQETLRRALFARLRYASALWGDVISYLGQAGSIAFMWRMNVVTVYRVFAVMATTSLLAAIVQFGQVRATRCSRWTLREVGCEFWGLSKWLMVAGLTGIFAGPLLPWLLNWTHGRAAAAEYQAVYNVLGPTNPLILSIPAIVMPVVASLMQHSQSESGFVIRRQVVRHVLQFEAMLMPWFLIVGIWPSTVLRWFYGTGSPYGAAILPLRIGVIIYFITVPLTVCGAALVAAKKPKANAFAQSTSTVASLFVAIPLASYAGVAGAMLADTFGRALKTCLLYRMLPRLSQADCQVPLAASASPTE